MITSIIKRDGRETVFDQTKIADAIEKAFQASGAMQDRSVAEQITDSVMEKLEEGAIEGTPTVEGVQDLVEEALTRRTSARLQRHTSSIAPSATACAT